MGDEPTLIIEDFEGYPIRLTAERRSHIEEHPEMLGQIARIAEVLAAPQLIVVTPTDEDVLVYHRYYETTPVTSKYLWVAVKFLSNDAFVVTAFFSNRPKKGTVLWQT